MTDVDAEARLAYLTRTVDLLWPDGSESTPMVVLPSTRTPRLLVPLRPRRAATAAVRRYTAQQGPRDRAAGALLAAAVAAGYGATRPRVRASTRDVCAESIDDHLAQALGHQVSTSLALTRDRPNRKPVLQVFDRRGRTVAFAKVGVTELAGRLVDAEADALRRLGAARLSSVHVPRVMSHARWHGHPVLVLSALPSGAAIPPQSPTLLAAMREVSAAGGGTVAAYLDTVRRRADDAGAVAQAWRSAFEDLLAARDLDRIGVGAWHGDWTTWNCARRRDQVFVWDWERFTQPAPIGFDRLHFVLNQDVGPRRDRFRAGAAALVARARELLEPWGLHGSDAQSVALLYLLDIALRYVRDGARSTDAGGRIEEWALPTVHAHLGVAR